MLRIIKTDHHNACIHVIIVMKYRIVNYVCSNLQTSIVIQNMHLITDLHMKSINKQALITKVDYILII